MGPVGPIIPGNQQNPSLAIRVQPDCAADGVKRHELIAKHRCNVDAAGEFHKSPPQPPLGLPLDAIDTDDSDLDHHLQRNCRIRAALMIRTGLDMTAISLSAGRTQPHRAQVTKAKLANHESRLTRIETITWIARPDGFDAAGGSARTSR